MKNGKKNTTLISVILICILAISSFFPTCVWAGNKEHVEKRVEELDSLNKEIIDLHIKSPQHGTIEFKAIVIDNDKARPNITILEKTIVTTPEKNKRATDTKNND